MGFSLQWSDEYKTGVDTIDEQHQSMFGFFAQAEAMVAQRNTSELPRVINALIEYAISHNAFEEVLMQQAGYPLLASHRKQHEEFKRRANGYKKKLLEGIDPIHVAREVRNDIGLWLINHIKEEDQKYVPAIRKNLHLAEQDGLVKKLLVNLFGKKA